MWTLFSLVFLLLATRAGYGATRIIDRIDVETGGESNDIHLYFNIPVRVISQVLSSTNRELNIQVQPTVTPGSAPDILSRDEALSWRPSAAIPLDRIRFSPRGIATSLIELSFVTPVQAVVVQEQKDFFSLTISLKRRTPVERVVLPETVDRAPMDIAPEAPAPERTEEIPVPEPDIDRPVVDRPKQPVKVAQGRLVINLMSQTRPIDFTEAPPVPAVQGTTLYLTEVEVDGQKWYRLRLGFFDTREAAERGMNKVRRLFPKAWIDTPAAAELAQFSDEEPPEATEPPALPAEPKEPPIRLPEKPTELPTTERLTLMMTTARDIMTAGDHPKAIRMLTAILAQPEHRYSQEALELLGLARERNGQFMHAYGEYEKYLKRYPEGEGAERVKQRLAGLVTATKAPQPELRKPRAQRAREKSPWDMFGSLALGYRYDGIDSEFSDEDTTRSEFDSSLYLSARRSIADGELRFQVTGGYTNDFLEGSAGNESTLSDAYVEFDHRPTDVFARFGRQRLRSSGILNRFDGVVVGHRFSRNLEGRMALGFPVEKSSDTFIQDEKRFVGLSVGLDEVLKNTDVDLFVVEQEVDGITDRRAVGGEVRYFEQTWSVFGLLDYDVHFGDLNTALLQGNWNYSPQTALYLILDYRYSPALTAFNALQGQPLTSIAALRDIFSDDEIFDLARDRAARSRTGSLGGTHTFENNLQLSGDFTVSNIGSTPGSGGVEAVESTGNEYFYSVQVSKPNLFKRDDIGILSIRYSDASGADTYTLTANSRYPVTHLLRINPKLAISYRDNKIAEGDRWTFAAQMRGDYRFRRDLLFEGELGATWYDEQNANESLEYTDYYFGLGVRWEF